MASNSHGEMQVDFWTEFAQRTDALELALREGDAPTLSRLVDELADCLSTIDERLNVNIYGPGPSRLGILPLPGAESAAELLVSNHCAPTHWEVAVGLPDFDQLDSVQVQDDSGDSLTILYADIEAKVLPPKNGSVTIVLSLDDDFDRSGPRGHLYQAAAENVVNTVLGGYPVELSRIMLLPRSKTGRLLPLDTMRQQWLDALHAKTSP